MRKGAGMIAWITRGLRSSGIPAEEVADRPADPGNCPPFFCPSHAPLPSGAEKV